jgi:RNA polymerase sigma factor (sigma-70 family)
MSAAALTVVPAGHVPAWPPPASAQRTWLLVAAAIWRAYDEVEHRAEPDAPPSRPRARYPTDLEADVDAEAEVRAAARELDRDTLLRLLFEREGAALVRLARLFTDDRNAAEDLVQEAFVRLHHAAHRIREPDRAAAYLRSIVLNLARDHNRRGLMSLRHFEALTPAVSPDAPQDHLELDEQQRRVIDALGALSPQQRDCLVLRFYFELSEREVGETLEISPNSVKTHCRRGYERLRTMLEPFA